MDKTYQPENIETQWYRIWEESNYFLPQGEGEPYCIMLPPPNVTGTLHMGHGFQVTLMDALIRYQRMQGKQTLWQAGTDHAGIATQMVVERLLEKEGLTREKLGREAFDQRVWQWKHQSDSTIKNQLRTMGASMDWTRERFTLDEGICDAVKEAFVTLYDEGLIYRGQRLVNWDPIFQSAISDLEVINQEEEGNLWHIRYLVVDSDESLVIATTRPETLLGDTAVAVHPDDQRYQHLIGKTVVLPLCHREIPIIADEYVDQTFGSGCVKITPAHDFNDYAVGKRHKLAMINVFTPSGEINDRAPLEFVGLDRFVAREKIIEQLQEQNLLVKTEPHKLSIPRGDRSGAVIEPFLTDQWFVKTDQLTPEAIKVVKEGKIQFVPENWSKTYFQWLDNIEDWCISRQLWWGHRIPAWYDNNGNIFVGRSLQEVREKYHLEDSVELKQDEDVLDTWFSSALWPFATLGWPTITKVYETFYPTQVLVTGFDIIFFWVARMIMFGLKFTDKIPFEKVYMTGLIRDSQGHKMSKSKGNVLDPIDLIKGISLDDLVTKRTANMMQPEMAEKIAKQTSKEFPQGIPAFGTDALRFTFCALACTGRDIRFSMGRIEGYRNFCNKLWNASRYVLMNCENYELEPQHSLEFSLADRYIQSKLQKTIQTVHEHFEYFRFDLLAQTLYEFIWNEFCDWYLELSKPILTNELAPQPKLRGTRYTLLYVLEITLRLCHPLMPYITEEIWQKVSKPLCIEGNSIMLQPYPTVTTNKLDEDAETEIEWLKKIIIGIRNIRGEMNISPNQVLPLLLTKGNAQDRTWVDANDNFLKTLAKLSDIRWLTEDQEIPFSATTIVNELELRIPMEDLIDKEVEVSRLNKEITKLQKDLNKTQNKLENPDYIKKAPKDIVEKERNRAQELQTMLAKLSKQLTTIEALPESSD